MKRTQDLEKKIFELIQLITEIRSCTVAFIDITCLEILL